MSGPLGRRGTDDDRRPHLRPSWEDLARQLVERADLMSEDPGEAGDEQVSSGFPGALAGSSGRRHRGPFCQLAAAEQGRDLLVIEWLGEVVTLPAVTAQLA
jgi:hypothetical protein